MGVDKISMTRNGVMIEAGTTWKLEERKEKERQDLEGGCHRKTQKQHIKKMQTNDKSQTSGQVGNEIDRVDDGLEMHEKKR